MNWIQEIYKETELKWKDAGSDERGYSIFYSPVLPQPRIVIVGYNPGGGSEDFTEVTVPIKHEYTHQSYPMAQKMRKIFDAAGLNIEETVKFNLIFFRSQKATDITNPALVDFSTKKAVEILEHLNPKVIIAEGFNTFARLLELTGGVEHETIRSTSKDRAILVSGETERKVKVLGIIHPTGGRGVSDEELTEIGQQIKKHVQ